MLAPVSLLPASAAGPGLWPRADLVSLHPADWSERSRLAGAAAGGRRPVLSPSRQLHQLGRGCRPGASVVGCPAARQLECPAAADRLVGASGAAGAFGPPALGLLPRWEICSLNVQRRTG